MVKSVTLTNGRTYGQGTVVVVDGVKYGVYAINEATVTLFNTVTHQFEEHPVSFLLNDTYEGPAQ